MSTILQNPAAAAGRFGPYGGRYVPETLMVPLFELERAYELAKADPAFPIAIQYLLRDFAAVPRRCISLLASPNIRRPAHLSQARRLAAHRRAQDQ